MRALLARDDAHARLVALDEQANACATADAEIGADAAPARTIVVTAREDREVARGVRLLLARSPGAVRWTRCSAFATSGSARLGQRSLPARERSGDGTV